VSVGGPAVADVTGVVVRGLAPGARDIVAESDSLAASVPRDWPMRRTGDGGTATEMKLSVQDLALPGLKLVTPRRFEDERGFFCETYNSLVFAQAGISSIFLQDNHSYSEVPGTIRGLQFQAPPDAQDRLVRVTRGRILDVAVDIRVGSPSYGRHVAVELSARDGAQLFVPAGFVHGLCTLVPDTEVVYKVSNHHAPQSEQGVLWSDRDLDIAWPSFAGARVSAKDRALPSLKEFRSPFRFERS
jgi:dTDP-4-dehydrorhamnose 3,5-epimerase